MNILQIENRVRHQVGRTIGITPKRDTCQFAAREIRERRDRDTHIAAACAERKRETDRQDGRFRNQRHEDVIDAQARIHDGSAAAESEISCEPTDAKGFGEGVETQSDIRDWQAGGVQQEENVEARNIRPFIQERTGIIDKGQEDTVAENLAGTSSRNDAKKVGDGFVKISERFSTATQRRKSGCFRARERIRSERSGQLDPCGDSRLGELKPVARTGDDQSAVGSALNADPSAERTHLSVTGDGAGDQRERPTRAATSVPAVSTRTATSAAR